MQVKVVKLGDALTVSPQPAAEDFVALAASGVRMVINNRPDGEEAGQLPAHEAACLAAANGLEYRHIPVTLAGLSEDSVRQFAQALIEAKGPVHAHCRSGQRSATLWALNGIMSGNLTREQARAQTAAAGYDLKPGLAWLDRHEAGRA